MMNRLLIWKKIEKNWQKKKADAFSKSETSSEEKFSFVNDHLPIVEDVIIKSYDEILNSRDGLIDLFNRAMKGWSKALDREGQWAEKPVSLVMLQICKDNQIMP